MGSQRGPRLTNAFPVTIDVMALYTNIPTVGQTGGIEAFKEALNKLSADLKEKIPTDYLIDLLTLVLEGNIFEFNSDLWQRKIGTAIGIGHQGGTHVCLLVYGKFGKQNPPSLEKTSLFRLHST